MAHRVEEGVPPLRLRRKKKEPFQVTGVAERLAAYDVSQVDSVVAPDTVEEEVVERAATILHVLPGRQRRETIEKIVSPNDADRGRAAVDALIDAAFVAEDESGRLRRVS